MLTHIEQKTLPYTAEQMFDLVVAVDQYSEFAPWCSASRINSRESDTIFYADLIVGYKMFRERFSSKVIAERPDSIYIEYLRGPLKHLKNYWRFIDQGDGSCVVDFSVEFEFKNKASVLNRKPIFKKVFKRSN